MKTVALCDVDGHGYPNLALMRIAAYHKAKGDCIEWFEPLFSSLYNEVYASKVFTFTADNPYLPPSTIRGGTGYDVASRLPEEIEKCAPDYSIYPNIPEAYGFMTRGCVNNCSFCVVPKKEGALHIVADAETVAQGRRDIVFMDNNFIAADRVFVREQLEWIIRNKKRIDFNQATDARRYDEEIADLFARVKWSYYPRVSCDHDVMIEKCINAANLLRKVGYGGEIMVFVLTKNEELKSAVNRINALLDFDKKFLPFVMPYRSLTDNSILPSRSVKHLARWCNRTIIRRACTLDEYLTTKNWKRQFYRDMENNQ